MNFYKKLPILLIMIIQLITNNLLHGMKKNSNTNFDNKMTNVVTLLQLLKSKLVTLLDNVQKLNETKKILSQYNLTNDEYKTMLLTDGNITNFIKNNNIIDANKLKENITQHPSSTGITWGDFLVDICNNRIKNYQLSNTLIKLLNKTAKTLSHNKKQIIELKEFIFNNNKLYRDQGRILEDLKIKNQANLIINWEYWDTTNSIRFAQEIKQYFPELNQNTINETIMKHYTPIEKIEIDCDINKIPYYMFDTSIQQDHIWECGFCSLYNIDIIHNNTNIFKKASSDEIKQWIKKQKHEKTINNINFINFQRNNAYKLYIGTEISLYNKKRILVSKKIKNLESGAINKDAQFYSDSKKYLLPDLIKNEQDDIENYVLWNYAMLSITKIIENQLNFNYYYSIFMFGREGKLTNYQQKNQIKQKFIDFFRNKKIPYWSIIGQRGGQSGHYFLISFIRIKDNQIIILVADSMYNKDTNYGEYIETIKQELIKIQNGE